MGENKKPVQARSIQTKENLLKAALAMYAKKGYHKTTVDDIASEAGLSTGIAYRYFKNKKDILLSVINYGAENIDTIAHIERPEAALSSDIRSYLRNVLKGFEQFHTEYHDIHEELEGLQHTDEDVRKLYSEISDEKMKDVAAKLAVFLNNDENIREKAYAAIGIMEQHCHMMMNNELYGLDTEVMRELTINAVLAVLKGE